MMDAGGELWYDEDACRSPSYITVNPYQMGDVPCIRGLRILVATVVGMIAEGMSEVEILNAYLDLVREDIREALRFATEAVRECELPILVAP